MTCAYCGVPFPDSKGFVYCSKRCGQDARRAGLSRGGPKPIEPRYPSRPVVTADGFQEVRAAFFDRQSRWIADYEARRAAVA